MLVLTRKYQEKIRIGDNIVITVLRTKGKAVRLGIEAPTDVPVIRGELAFEPAAERAMPGLAADSAAITTKQTRGRLSKSAPGWAVEPPQSPTAGRVQHQRVPRAEKASILPHLVAGTAPLRAMMDRR
jgi:carbon storage regulator